MTVTPTGSPTETLLPADRASVFCDGTLSDPQLNHPEGLAVAADGAIWCGGEAGELFRIAPDGTSFELRASTGGFVLGMAFDRDGRLYACDLKHGAVFRYDQASDRLERWADGDGERTIAIPNWPVVDHARGVLYVSDSHAADEAGGGVWRFDLATGTGSLWYDRPMVFANGMALSADGAWLYVAETFANRVSRVPIDADGSPGIAEVFAADLPGLPDGLAFDAEGRIYVGCYEPSRLLRIDADATIHVLIEDLTAHTLCHPTNVAFRRDELFTSNLGRWHITRVDVQTPGLPLL